ncbi:MAG: hypothetical protein PHD32_08565 [Eubacteriales bacterium]|nr:hypothetical protein [Eubacteriales bacterium]
MNRITHNAVKESFDNLPSDVCFFDHNGIAILCNRQMRRLVFSMMGTDLQSLDDIQHILGGEAKNAAADRGVFLLPNGSAGGLAAAPSLAPMGKHTPRSLPPM